MFSSTIPSVKVVRSIEVVRDQIARLHRSMMPAPAVMMELVTGAWVAQAIVAAADLGIADALADRPLSADELATAVNAEADTINRLLRALISRGIFRQHRDGRYDLTPLADSLRSDAEVSLAAFARFVGSPQHREHWSHLTDAIRTGQAVIPALRGKPAFEYLHEEPELAEIFNDAMTSSPQVVAGAPAVLEEHRVAERVRIVEGSFFDAVPAGGDAYILKNVIHDWPDDDAVHILGNVRKAAAAGKNVLLVELVIPQHNRDFLGKWLDLEMLVGAGARERSAAEYGQLLSSAGFRMTRVVETASPFSVVEAIAV